MAGIIVFKSGDWRASGDTFRGMAAGVCSHLHSNASGLLIRDELKSSVDSRVYFVDATTAFTADLLAEFSNALDLHVAETIAQGPDALPNPAVYEGYLARLDELRSLIAKDRELHENEKDHGGI